MKYPVNFRIVSSINLVIFVIEIDLFILWILFSEVALIAVGKKHYFYLFL